MLSFHWSINSSRTIALFFMNSFHDLVYLIPYQLRGFFFAIIKKYKIILISGLLYEYCNNIVTIYLLKSYIYIYIKQKGNEV